MRLFAIRGRGDSATIVTTATSVISTKDGEFDLASIPEARHAHEMRTLLETVKCALDMAVGTGSTLAMDISSLLILIETEEQE